MKRVALLALLALGLLGAPAFADGGGLHGYVVDGQEGDVVSGAVITVVGPSGSLETRSNEKGFYAFIGLLPGSYYVVAQKQGYYADDCSERPIEVHTDEVRTFVVYIDSRLLLVVCAQRRPSIIDPDATADVYDVN